MPPWTAHGLLGFLRGTAPPPVCSAKIVGWDGLRERWGPSPASLDGSRKGGLPASLPGWRGTRAAEPAVCSAPPSVCSTIPAHDRACASLPTVIALSACFSCWLRCAETRGERWDWHNQLYQRCPRPGHQANFRHPSRAHSRSPGYMSGTTLHRRWMPHFGCPARDAPASTPSESLRARTTPTLAPEASRTPRATG
jgi:hypothetical protein